VLNREILSQGREKERKEEREGRRKGTREGGRDRQPKTKQN
jgi:hypothetical protein